uniref:Transmembrane protein n=1 Tax=Fagus sylvatica TaxID=28930 RepID=A0A2N9FRM1_FAGSY
MGLALGFNGAGGGFVVGLMDGLGFAVGLDGFRRRRSAVGFGFDWGVWVCGRFRLKWWWVWVYNGFGSVDFGFDGGGFGLWWTMALWMV